MQEQKYDELERRASVPEEMDKLRQLEARMRVQHEIQRMKEEGKALVLTEEEESLLLAFRRFKLRMRKDVEQFRWDTAKPSGVQIVEDTAQIVHPQEHPHG